MMLTHLLHELLNHSNQSSDGGDFNLSMDRGLLRREVMVLVRCVNRFNTCCAVLCCAVLCCVLRTLN